NLSTSSFFVPELDKPFALHRTSTCPEFKVLSADSSIKLMLDMSNSSSNLFF
ncbi:33352_t:CDS:2, partial [Racocetra persica]